MAKGTTWQKAKMAKHRNNIKLQALGGFKQGSDNPARADRRDGGYYRVEPVAPVAMGPFKSQVKYITKCGTVEARGLSRDIGRVGKAGRAMNAGGGCTSHRMLHSNGGAMAAAREEYRVIGVVWPLYVKA
jgi:hypothetical protein